MTSFNEYLFPIIAYLMGSIPFGIIVARIAGIGDITKQGSGNIGATNVSRIGGRKLGIITFLLDFLKVYIPVTIYIYYFGSDINALICAILGVIGHVLPALNRFRGGKGVAPGFGAIMAISPLGFVITGLIWIGIYRATRISSAAALGTFTLMPFIMMAVTKNENVMIFAIILSTIIYVRHLPNIKRLLNGTESKFKRQAANEPIQ